MRIIRITDITASMIRIDFILLDSDSNILFDFVPESPVVKHLLFEIVGTSGSGRTWLQASQG